MSKKFKDYLAKLNKLAEERTETLDMDIIFTSGPDNFSLVEFDPSIGSFSIPDFWQPESDEVLEDINAVCIN